MSTSSTAFVRVATPMVIVADVARLEGAPAGLQPRMSVPAARVATQRHGTVPADAIEKPDSAAFGLYTWLSNVERRPAYVFTYTVPRCQAAAPAGAAPAVTSRSDCAVIVVVDDADGHVINTIVTGGPA